jgi:5'-methylthioadenosine phosphorylase
MAKVSISPVFGLHSLSGLPSLAFLLNTASNERICSPREMTFYKEFEPGKMKHTPMADPFARSLRDLIISSAWNIDLNIHDKGTIVTIEGQRFSTRAESKMFRMWGAHIINMLIAPEAVLANELGIPYTVIAISTDYDCRKEDEVPVSWEDVIVVFNENVSHVIRLLNEVIPRIE